MNAKAGIFPIIVSCLFFSFKAYQLGMSLGNDSGRPATSRGGFSAGNVNGNPFSSEPIAEATAATSNTEFKPRRGAQGEHSNPFVD